MNACILCMYVCMYLCMYSYKYMQTYTTVCIRENVTKFMARSFRPVTTRAHFRKSCESVWCAIMTGVVMYPTPPTPAVKSVFGTTRSRYMLTWDKVQHHTGSREAD